MAKVKVYELAKELNCDSKTVSFYIWALAIALHLALIIYFTVKFILKLQMSKVFASYYIV